MESLHVPFIPLDESVRASPLRSWILRILAILDVGLALAFLVCASFVFISTGDCPPPEKSTICEGGTEKDWQTVFLYDDKWLPVIRRTAQWYIAIACFVVTSYIPMLLLRRRTRALTSSGSEERDVTCFGSINVPIQSLYEMARLGTSAAWFMALGSTFGNSVIVREVDCVVNHAGHFTGIAFAACLVRSVELVFGRAWGAHSGIETL